MSNRPTEILAKPVTRADLPTPPPSFSKVPFFALIGASIGFLFAMIQLSVLQNPEPTAVYTTIWTLLLWPFGLAGAGLLVDHYLLVQKQEKLKDWCADMIVYAMDLQQRHVIAHTTTAVDERTLSGMVDSIIAGRQLAAPEPSVTLAEKLASQIGKFKTEALTTLLSWIGDVDHIWSSDQWSMIETMISIFDSGTHSPKIKSTRMLSLETPPPDFQRMLADHPTDLTQAVLEWVTDTQTEWTAQQWKLVEAIANAATQADFEPKIEVTRSRRARPS